MNIYINKKLHYLIVPDEINNKAYLKDTDIKLEFDEVLLLCIINNKISNENAIIRQYCKHKKPNCRAIYDVLQSLIEKTVLVKGIGATEKEALFDVVLSTQTILVNTPLKYKIRELFSWLGLKNELLLTTAENKIFKQIKRNKETVVSKTEITELYKKLFLRKQLLFV